MNIVRVDRDLRISKSDVNTLYWFDAEASLCWNVLCDSTKHTESLYLTQKGNWILHSIADVDSVDLISSFTAAILLLPRIKQITCSSEIGDAIALALHRRTLSGPPGPYTEKQREALQEAIDYALLGEL